MFSGTAADTGPHEKPVVQGAQWEGQSYRMKFSGHGKSYGTPMEGTRCEARGLKAGTHISKVNVTMQQRV